MASSAATWQELPVWKFPGDPGSLLLYHMTTTMDDQPPTWMYVDAKHALSGGAYFGWCGNEKGLEASSCLDDMLRTDAMNVLQALASWFVFAEHQQQGLDPPDELEAWAQELAQARRPRVWLLVYRLRRVDMGPLLALDEKMRREWVPWEEDRLKERAFNRAVCRAGFAGWVPVTDAAARKRATSTRRQQLEVTEVMLCHPRRDLEHVATLPVAWQVAKDASGLSFQWPEL